MRVEASEITPNVIASLEQLGQVSNKGIITATKYWPIVREFTGEFSSQRAYIKEKVFINTPQQKVLAKK